MACLNQFILKPNVSSLDGLTTFGTIESVLVPSDITSATMTVPAQKNDAN